MLREWLCSFPKLVIIRINTSQNGPLWVYNDDKLGDSEAKGDYISLCLEMTWQFDTYLLTSTHGKRRMLKVTHTWVWSYTNTLDAVRNRKKLSIISQNKFDLCLHVYQHRADTLN